jgi:hypothetical protein
MQVALELKGSWFDSYGTDHDISSSTWSQSGGSSLFNISSYDNDGDFLIAQNDAANTFAAEKWSRFEWSYDTAGDLWYCQIAFDAETEADAEAAGPADAADLEGSGCNGFSWTAMGLPLEIAGSYIDNFATDHVISSSLWSQSGGSSLFNVSSFDNDGDFLIAQNDSANGFAADMWSRFEWTYHTDGGLWYCQIAYEAATEADAEAAGPADAADLEGAGCNGFSWTSMTAD